MKVLLFLIALVFAASLAVAQTQDPRENAKQGPSTEQFDQRSGDSNVRSKKPLRMKDDGTLVSEIGRSATVSVSLSTEQWQKIRDYFSRRKDQRVDSVDFALSVGSAVPRQAQLHDLPPELTDTVQQYRKKQYILVGDRLVIVEPQSRHIVAVIPDVYWRPRPR